MVSHRYRSHDETRVPNLDKPDLPDLPVQAGCGAPGRGIPNLSGGPHGVTVWAFC